MTRPDAGYTLIELVVALLLISLIGLLIGGSFRFGARVWERTDDAVSASNDTVAAQTILREILGSATPNMSAGYASFDGAVAHAAFDAPAPPAFGGGGIVHVALVLERAGDGSRIALTLTSPFDKNAERKAVLTVVNEPLELSYLDASGGKPSWLAVWHDRERLPDAVRIAGALPAAGASWPPLIVRLPVAEDGSCVFDPVTVGCRRA